MRRRVLHLDIAVPRPDRAAMHVRSLQLLEMFVDRGFDVDVASLVRSEDRDDAVRLRALGVNSLPWCEEAQRHAFLDDRGHDYGIICIAWAKVARRFIDHARRAAPSALLIFDTQDVNHVREYREARVTGSERTLRRALQSRAVEAQAMRAADCTLAITDADAAALRALAPGARVAVVGMWRKPAPVARVTGDPTLLFLGNYGTPHNHDAALQLATEILPRVRQRRARARLILAGSDPSEALLALAGEHVAVPGWRADLKPHFSTASVFVSPLRFGSGLKGKLLEAMAHGVPIVASAIAAEGMGLVDGTHYLKADTPDDAAEAALRIIDDGQLGRCLAANAIDLLAKNFTRSVVDRQFAAVLALSRPSDVQMPAVTPNAFLR